MTRAILTLACACAGLWLLDVPESAGLLQWLKHVAGFVCIAGVGVLEERHGAWWRTR